MLPDIPLYLTITFILTAFFTVGIFASGFWESKNPKTKRWTHTLLLGVLFWMIFLSVLAINNYFIDRKATPPHVAIPVFISLGIILISFGLPRFRRTLDSISLESLTWLHVVRIPVEISLYWLFLEKQVPESMTFSGINFDILSGITAPIVVWAYFKREIIGSKILLLWNVLSLALLFIIVIRAFGAAPSPIQKWDFEQPNYAVLHFPFIWLPGVIVPLVFWSHLIAIRRLVLKKA
ncbi:MAG: hypothetical protein SGI87_09105 [Flavobacteriales bacterium]|nr:hypothetical protein [Flavobacteriales bacterium]